MGIRNLSINLTNKIFLYFLIIGLGGIAMSSYFSFNFTRRAILNRTFDQLTSVRVLKKRQIENFFSDRINELNQLAVSKNTQHFFGNDVFKNQNFDLKHDYTLFLNNSFYFETLYVSDFKQCFIIKEDTVFIASDSLITNEKLFLSTIKKIEERVKKEKLIIVEDFQIDSLGKHDNKIYFAAPVFVSNQLKGMLVLSMTSDAINNIMLIQDNRSGLGESGESYLVGNDYFMRSSSRFKDNSFLNVEVKTIASENAFNNIEKTAIINDYRKVKVLSSYSSISIHGLKWAILAEIDFKEVMLDIENARNKIIIIGIILCLIILPVSYLISGKITHPIIKLNHALNQVGEGSFNINLKAVGNDEISSLTESFNLMTDKLSQQAKEVKEREERLQHFYDATKDAIILHHNNIPVLFNQAACSITGYNEAELKRMTIDGFLILRTEQSASQSPFKNIIYETKLVRKDETLLNVEVQENTIEYKGNFIKAHVIRDISRRKKAEKGLLEEREKRMSSLIDGQEMERQRLSRELHDSLGQYFIAIKLKLESASDSNAEKTKLIIEDVKEHFDTIIDEVRRISNDLMPAVLYEFGIQMALSNLCRRIEDVAPFEVRFYSNLTGDYYSKKIKTYIYRISQEALNNCVKHSKATLVKVYLIESAGTIKLIIKDNGKGFAFDQNYINTGKGLINMKERAQLINAKFEIKSALEQGTEINVEIINEYDE